MPDDNTTPPPSDAWDNTSLPAEDTNPDDAFPSFDEHVTCILRDFLNIQHENSNVLCEALITANCNNWDEFQFLNEDLINSLTDQNRERPTPIADHHILSLTTLVAYMEHLESTKGACASLKPSNYNVADYTSFRHSRTRKVTSSQTTVVGEDGLGTACNRPEDSDIIEPNKMDLALTTVSAEDLVADITTLDAEPSRKSAVPLIAVACCLMVGFLGLNLIMMLTGFTSLLSSSIYGLFCLTALGMLCLYAVLNARTAPPPDDSTPQKGFPQDVYSFVAVFSPKDEADQFCFGILVFLFQAALFMLMILSVTLRDLRTIGEVDNPDTGFWAEFIPANAPPIVRATQVMAILTYMIFPEASMMEILVGTEMFPQLRRTNMSAEVYQMGFSCVLRVVQGTLGLFAVFLLVMTSTDVIDVVLNFTAANFISLIDDTAFTLARSGAYGWKLEDAAKKVENQPCPSWSIPQHKNRRSRIAICTMTAIVSSLMVFIIYSQEDHSKWVTSTIQLKFGDSLEKFSGCYDLMPNTRHTKRYNYQFSRGDHIQIGFCEKKQQWVLFDGSLDDGTFFVDPCLAFEPGTNAAEAYSTKTGTFDVSSSLSSPWYSMSRQTIDLVVGDLGENNRKNCQKYEEEVGVCNVFFNTKEYEYDEGDCCVVTCDHPDCGQGGLDSSTVFDTEIISGDGYKNCADPSMKEVFIELDTITLNGQSPTLIMECDNKTVFKVPLLESMTTKAKTAVKVSPVGNCTADLEFSGIGTDPPSELSYTIFGISPYGSKNIISRQRISTKGKGKYFEIFNIYHETSLEGYAFPKLKNERKLELKSKELTGSIPSEIGVMTLLGLLQLGENSLTGSIPTDIGHLSKLTKLYLYDNDLTGPIPSEIGSMTQLITLSAHNNMFTGSIPSQIGLLSDLIFFRLDSTRSLMTGSIPSEIGFLSQLTYLKLVGDAITGTIPSEIEVFTEILFISLQDNMLTGSIPTEIGSMTAVTAIELANNMLTGIIPSEIGKLTGLTKLSIFGNQLSGSIPSEFGLLTKLTILQLSMFLHLFQTFFLKLMDMSLI
mmetsp:Transcript_21914/g.60922  ORF Transcript_21914/g.60922 Transcript_21914/m.60922 type:complete len:1053 (+) Transcript_21914:403-3561(+)